jgi:hypothetical protein
VLTLAMMFSSHLVALSCALVVFRCFVVGVLGHVFLLASNALSTTLRLPISFHNPVNMAAIHRFRPYLSFGT